MSNEAWNEYRGWDKRANLLQSSTKNWNRIALACVCLAAICGAASAFVGEQNALNKWFAGAAALMAAVAAFLGKNILAAGNEAGWLQARAIAEGIKSECYLFAAKAGDYASPNALQAFQSRRTALETLGRDKQLTPSTDGTADGEDKYRPPADMSDQWYIQWRIQDQIDFYDRRRADHEYWVTVMDAIAFGSGLAAVVFAALGGFVSSGFAPWIGAITTITAAIVAAGLLDRRKYIIASYAAMSSSLRRAKEMQVNSGSPFPDFVTRTEELLQSEHKAWLDQMTQTISAPPAPQQPPPAAK